MAERIVPEPSLTAVATPVDRFVAPLRQQPGEDPVLGLAKTLQAINPSIQKHLAVRHADYSAEEEAKGAQADTLLDDSVRLDENRKTWKDLIDAQREIDKAQGTNNADRLAAASPHFRRGLMKARAQRMGMALNDHLASLYSRNPEVEVNGETVQLHDIDDPAVIQQWVNDQVNEYTGKFGINNLDPVLVEEVYSPIARRSSAALVDQHTALRLDRYKHEYTEEMSATAGMILNGGQPEGDGYNEAGLTAEAKSAMEALEAAIGKKLKVNSAFRDPEHNKRVGGAKNSQHTHGNAFDVDVTGMSIEERQELIRQARRAGFGGIGVYKNALHFDVANERNWGHDFSGRTTPKWAQEALQEPVGKPQVAPARAMAARLQNTLDRAVADGIDPKVANKNIVSTIITQAINEKEPAYLTILDEIEAGSGPLGNVGWVKELRRQAEDKITDDIWQEETREHTRSERERTAQARAISTEAFRAILDDPFGDHSQWEEQALNSGNPALVQSIRSLQNSVLDDIYKVRTNHEAYADIRHRIYTSADPASKAEIAQEIVRGTGTLWAKADAESLMDALEQSERNLDVFDDDLVQQSIRSLNSTIKGRFGTKDFMGNTVGGDEEAITATTLAYDELADWLEKNQEASRQDVRRAFRGIVKEILNDEEFSNPEAGTQPRQVGEIPNPQVQEEVPVVSLEGASVEQVQAFGKLLSSPEETLATIDLTALTPVEAEMINQAAAAFGMSAQAFIEKYGSNQ